MVGHDVDVRGGVRYLRLDADKPTSDVAAVEIPNSTVSPAKTLATFSSAGSMMRVDCSKPARIAGGASASDTVTVRGAAGWRWCG